MPDLRQLLCDNEEKNYQFLKSLGQITNLSHRQSFINDLKHDGNLIEYAKVSSSSKEAKATNKLLHDYGYATTMDLIGNYMSGLNVDDYFEVQDLVKEAQYSSFEIAGLARKYTIQKGMLDFERDGTRYVTITSHPDNPNSAQGYTDTWIDKPNSLWYSPEKETDMSSVNFSFSKTPNKLIFNSIMTNATDPLKILLFVRYRRGDKFTYQGVYRAVSYDKVGKRFYLANVDVSDRDPDINKAREEFSADFLGTDEKKIVSQKKTLRVEPAPKKGDNPRKTASSPFISERDYIYEARLRQKIGDIGEEAVWEYEQKKIRDALPNDPLTAQRLIDSMEWVSKKPGGEIFGYDIKSYNVVNGKGVPIFIEVKTTTGGKFSRFFITNHELETARSIAKNENYYIYRVFNINSDEPGVCFFKGNPDKFVELKPYIYLAKVG